LCGRRAWILVRESSIGRQRECRWGGWDDIGYLRGLGEHHWSNMGVGRLVTPMRANTDVARLGQTDQLILYRTQRGRGLDEDELHQLTGCLKVSSTENSEVGPIYSDT
jgi:hypothetical protein